MLKRLSDGKFLKFLKIHLVCSGVTKRPPLSTADISDKSLDNGSLMMMTYLLTVFGDNAHSGSSFTGSPDNDPRAVDTLDNDTTYGTNDNDDIVGTVGSDNNITVDPDFDNY